MARYLCTKCGWHGGEPLNAERHGKHVMCPRCPYLMLTLSDDEEAEAEHARLSALAEQEQAAMGEWEAHRYD